MIVGADCARSGFAAEMTLVSEIRSEGAAMNIFSPGFTPLSPATKDLPPDWVRLFREERFKPAYFLCGIGVTPTCSSAVYGAP